MPDFVRILPEVCIALTLIFVLIAEVTYYGERHRLILGISLVGLAGALAQVLVSYRTGSAFAFFNAVSVDSLALFFKFLFIVLSAFSLMASAKSTEIPHQRRGEFYALILFACLGMCVAAGSAELLLTFVALQAVNTVVYLMAGFGKGSLKSTEAGVKYLVFSGIAGVCFLYATAILFSVAHSFDVYEIHKALLLNPLSLNQMLVVFALFVIALGFQMTLFPLSLWAPDVIEGAPTPVSSFIAAGIPTVGFAVAIRLFLAMFTQSAGTPGEWKILGELQWTQILTLLAASTMLFGAFLSLRQTSVKRMVGCLVVAQTGFFLMGLLVLDQAGVAALLYNLIVEVFAVIGVFYVLSFFYDALGSDQLSDFKGILARSIPECICLMLFLLCLVGVPPMPGFIGKFALIGIVIRHGQISLAIVAIAAIALSTVTIFRVAFSLVGDFRTPSSTVSAIKPHRKIFLAALLIPMAGVGVFAQFFLNWAARSLGFIFW